MSEATVTRARGFYWVQGIDTPEPALWDGGNWYRIGAHGPAHRAGVLSERPIVMENLSSATPAEERLVGPEDEDRAGPEAPRD
jgi:hypothetical protein